MAYSFAIPPALPLPADAVAGSTESVRLAGALSAAVNAAHALSVPRPIGQAWPDGTCAYAGAPKAAATWRVPLISDAHVSLTIDIDGQNAGGVGGTVRIKSTVAWVDFVFAGVVGTATRLTGTVNLAVGAAYDDVTMTMRSASGADFVQVNRLSCEVTPLASPLAAGRVALGPGGSFDPASSLAVASDTPLSARIGELWRADLDGLLQRPRALLCWSGLDLPLAPGSISHGPYEHAAFVLVSPGSRRAGAVYTAWVKVLQGASATRVHITTAHEPRSWPRGRESSSSQLATIDVPVGAAVVWYSATFTLPENGARFAGSSHPGAVVGVTLDPTRPASETSAELRALSIWGE